MVKAVCVPQAWGDEKDRLEEDKNNGHLGCRLTGQVLCPGHGSRRTGLLGGTFVGASRSLELILGSGLSRENWQPHRFRARPWG